MNTKKISYLTLLSFISLFFINLPLSAENINDIYPDSFGSINEQDSFNIIVTSSKSANTPFPVKIISNNNLTAKAHLHSEFGHITPSYIEIVNGKWDGNISISEPGKGNRIEIHWADEKNNPRISHSNTFNIADNKSDMLPIDSTLAGKVTDTNKDPIQHAKVTMKIANKTIFSHRTNSNGDYLFKNIYPGTYNLNIEKDGHHTFIKKTKLTSKRKTTENIKLAKKIDKSDKTPVILIPGIMGSYAVDHPFWAWPYPTLPPTSPAWDSGELAPLDPFSSVGWNRMTKTLENLGYTQGLNIFTVPYDWSLPIPDIAQQYLIPWIQHAKQISGQDKVDVIAHSMGGLVTRSYVQSENYDQDVRKLAMVGTPNKGATSAYYIWESADPITADTIFGTPSVFKPGAYFYSNTLSLFYQDRLHGHVCKFGDIKRYTPMHCDRDKIYTVAHQKAISTGQLLPIFDHALYKQDGDSLDESPLVKEENAFLKALNNINCFNPSGCSDTNGKPYIFKDPKLVFTPDEKGVQTALFRGTNNRIIESIVVEPQKDSYDKNLNRDGIPQSVIFSTKGDGTVLAESVDINDYLSPNATLPIQEKDSEHSALVANFLHELAEFITDSTVSNDDIHKHEGENLAISIKGRIQIDTESITHNANQIDTSDILDQDHKPHSSGLTLKTQHNDTYKIPLSAPYNESYELSISYYDEASKHLFRENYLGYYDYSLKSFDLELNNEHHENPLVLGRCFQTPSQLKITDKGDKILLTWQDKTADNENDVSHYELFWKKDSDHKFKLLARTETNDKKYLINHMLEDSKTNVYAVRAVLNDGTSTFLSHPEFHIEPENIISHK